MCRIFGFRSVIQSQVHHSLMDAENALGIQSEEHPDGWGVAYYQAGAPHVIKSNAKAMEDTLFKKVSGIVSSNTVVAHIRAATEGGATILNTHPFQYGNWVFAHNGNIKGFKNIRKKLIEEVHPQLRRFILGDTDSEVLFFLLLSELEKKIDLEKRICKVDQLVTAAKTTVEKVVHFAGPYTENDGDPPTETFLTFILTNGQCMLAHQGGKHLHFSTHKKRCGERDTCAHFSEVCEAPTNDGPINHLIFSSEPLSGENIWQPMSPGEIIGVDGSMHLFKQKP